MKRFSRISSRSSTPTRSPGVRRVLFALLVTFGCAGAGAQQPPAPPAQCVLHLLVHLTPDVPNPRDSGFVSSLLGDHPDYRLSLRHVVDDTHLDMLLYGPGPRRSCSQVVDSMRRDARILSIDVQ